MAPMSAPIPLPPERPAAPNHGAREIAAMRRHAPGCCSVTLAVPFRPAPHGRPAHQHMALALTSDRHADQLHQLVSGPRGAHLRARLVRPACAVHLPRSDAGEPDLRPLCASDRSVAVVDRRWCAGERHPSRDDGSSEYSEDKRHQKLAHSSSASSKASCMSGSAPSVFSRLRTASASPSLGKPRSPLAAWAS